MDPEDFELLTRFGMEGSLKQVEKNPALGVAFKQVLLAAGVRHQTAEKQKVGFLFTVASGLPDKLASRREMVARYIASGQLVTLPQVLAAVEYFKKRAAVDAEPVPVAEFEAACGAGVTITDEELREHTARLLQSHAAAIAEQRFLFQTGPLMSGLREGRWRWADTGKSKNFLDEAFAALVGPRLPEDDEREAAIREARKAAEKAAKAAAKGAAKEEKPSSGAAGAGGSPAVMPGSQQQSSSVASASPADQDVFVARALKSSVNSPALLEAHRVATGGKIRTRFPPEPNGFLHIGHAKSMNLNFEGAFRALGLDPATQGDTTFRYDDTNPDSEAIEYIISQAENVQWLGWRPARVTHSSDYFHQLYDCAVKLISAGKAYVCHQTKEEMEVSREIARARDGRDPSSPWRNRPVAESLRDFEAMRHGKFDEGKAVLRLKIDWSSPNPTLWDPVAYRIKFAAHPMTGKEWCIYPNYDFSHCIIDSIENIDYSLCTLEFEVRRDLYYWTLEALDIYRPYVFEFSRLNINRNVLSKRKFIKLVNDKKVRGWDDPRLLTINGLRRRGYTPEAINSFCRDIGVTRNDNTLDPHRLEFWCRESLDDISKRAFVVLRPLKISLTNVTADYCVGISAPDFPRDKSRGEHTIYVTNTVYVDRDDYRDIDDPDFFGLAPGKVVGLRYGGYVKVEEVLKNDAGEVVELRAAYDHGRTWPGKVKGNLHWVSASTPGAQPASAEVRLYESLFTTDEPGSSGDWEAEINPNSETVLTSCYIDASLAGEGKLKLWDHFQFERLGFFVADKDSDFATGKLVFNHTVSLKEDSSAKKIKGGKA